MRPSPLGRSPPVGRSPKRKRVEREGSFAGVSFYAEMRAAIPEPKVLCVRHRDGQSPCGGRACTAGAPGSPGRGAALLPAHGFGGREHGGPHECAAPSAARLSAPRRGPEDVGKGEGDVGGARSGSGPGRLAYCGSDYDEEVTSAFCCDGVNGEAGDSEDSEADYDKENLPVRMLPWDDADVMDGDAFHGHAGGEDGDMTLDDMSGTAGRSATLPSAGSGSAPSSVCDASVVSFTTAASDVSGCGSHFGGPGTPVTPGAVPPSPGAAAGMPDLLVFPSDLHVSRAALLAASFGGASALESPTDPARPGSGAAVPCGFATPARPLPDQVRSRRALCVRHHSVPLTPPPPLSDRV